MSRHVVGTLIVALIISGGCSARSVQRGQVVASQSYQLIVPPEMRDEHYPGGLHIRPDAPRSTWHQVAVFATNEECESSRITRIDDSIDKARAEVGEQAKYAFVYLHTLRAQLKRRSLCT